MRRSSWLIAAWLSMAGALRTEPEFAFGFAAEERYEGHPQRPVRFEVRSTISAGGLEPGALGARAWTMSIAAGGCRVMAATTAGTIAAPHPVGLQKGGFFFSEVTIGPGNEGVVSGCVLSFDLPVALAPSPSPQEVLRLTVEAVAPIEGDPCSRPRLEYRDGLLRSGVAAVNEVASGERVLKPSLGDISFELCATSQCSTPRVDLIFQEAPIVGNRHVTSELFAGQVDEVTVGVRRGDQGAVKLYAAIVSQLPENSGGVQGWSLSGAARGELLLIDATTSGTAAAYFPDGLTKGGFHVAELVEPERIHPDTGLPQGPGFISAVVLGFGQPIAVAPMSTATVLALSLEAAEEQGDGIIAGQVVWYDHMAGSGLPVENVATVGGDLAIFCRRRRVKIRFVPSGRFIRCDANEDGRLDVADAVFMVRALFRGGRVPACREAADCNASGSLDLSDALFLVQHLYRSGPAPRAPYPRCGEDPETAAVCLEPAACR